MNYKLVPVRIFRHACKVALCCLLVSGFSQIAVAQNAKALPPETTPPKLTRTVIRHETREMSYGSTLSIVGAPAGTLKIEGWRKNELDVTAEVVIHANSEADLQTLSVLNTFRLDEDFNHFTLLAVGAHDKAYLKRIKKKVAPELMNLSWEINYTIHVPQMTDMDINAGRGAIVLNAVEGAIILRALESDATFNLAGGLLQATIGKGAVRMNLLQRTWRGAGIKLELANGDMTVNLPVNYTGEIDAGVLRTGTLENNFAPLRPRPRTTPAPNSLQGRAGVGGTLLSFTVGDGKLLIKPQSVAENQTGH